MSLDCLKCGAIGIVHHYDCVPNSGRSAWCSTAPGVPRHDAQHKVCDMRLKAGQIATCTCPDHPKKDAA